MSTYPLEAASSDIAKEGGGVELQATAPLTGQATEGCLGSSLTSDWILDLLYKLVTRRTLLDIPFIERTLKLQFSERLYVDGGGTNTSRKIYTSEFIFDKPASVNLYIDTSVSQLNIARNIGILRISFDRQSACFQTSLLDIARKFQDFERVPPIPLPGADDYISIRLNGESGSTITASFIASTSRTSALGVVIDQNIEIQ